MLKYRPIGSRTQQSVVLPLSWEPSSTDKALLLISRIAVLVMSGKQDSLKGALSVARGESTTMRQPVDWRAVAGDFQKTLMSGSNQIRAETWKANYARYIEEARRLIEGGKATDGYDLLKLTLERWDGKPSSRAACCIALRNFTDYAIARHNAATCWRIDDPSIKELRGRGGKRRVKATLDDRELLWLICEVSSRNPSWANVLRLLSLFGLRPVELQYLQPKIDKDGRPGVWCGYTKNCGGALTDARWLKPCWLLDEGGHPVRWSLIEDLHSGKLDLPKSRSGGPRKLNGHYVEQFLSRQPEWKELGEKCEARGEWLRGYSFRDSYSLRCHRQKIEVGSVARAMGHSLEVHARSYRWSSDEQTAAAFDAAFPTIRV